MMLSKSAIRAFRLRCADIDLARQFATLNMAAGLLPLGNAAVQFINPGPPQATRPATSCTEIVAREVRQSALAALMTVFELTKIPDIIALVILFTLISNMTAGKVFSVRSLFALQMEILGPECRKTPMKMALIRSTVASIMARSAKGVTPVIRLVDGRLLFLQETLQPSGQ